MSAKCAAEGWLIKKKAKDKNAFFSKDNLRYFKIQEVRGQDYAELAFAYFKTQKDKEARGWIYLKDISEIYDDERAFTVVSAARTMIIEAQNPTEYLMWLQTLVEYCPNADTSQLRTPIASSKKMSTKTVQSKDTSDDTFQTLDALNVRPSGVTKNFSKSNSLFSRQADGENNSFYIPSQGIHKVYSSSHSDVDGTEQPSASYAKELLEDTDEENNGMSGPVSRNHSRNNSREFSNSNTNYTKTSQDREDHRKQGYRGSSGNSNATNRLHQHISKENSANGVAGSAGGGKGRNMQRLPSELEEISMDNSTSVGNNYRGVVSGGGGGKKVAKKQDSNGSMFSLAEEEEDYDGAESGSNRFTNSPASNNHNNSSNNLMYSNESMLDEEAGDHGKGSGGGGGGDFGLSGKDGGERGSLKKMHAANMSIHIDAKELAVPPPTVAKASPTAAAGGGGTGKRGMPTNAPPKRAVDSLNQVEAVINSAAAGDVNGSGKARLSIDELLYRKKGAASADSKQGDRGRAGNKQSDDSDEEEVDFKAEMRHYSNNVTTASTESVMSSGSSAAVSKPPRAPVNSKSPYVNAASSNSTNNISGGQHMHGSHTRSNTPPRRPQDPGARTDSNFVTDNWDEDDNSDNDDGRNRRHRGGGGRRGAAAAAGGKGNSQPPSHSADDKAVAGRDQFGNAVKQDENWLEENFDD